MSLQHLILLRHGETDWNAVRRMQGHRDIPLNDTGLAQAAAAAPSVAALRPEIIVSSDLARAFATAGAVAAITGQQIVVDQRLRETSLGLWEGLTREDVVAGWPGEWQQWRTTSAHYAPPEGESRSQVAARAAAVVDELDAGDTGRALLVAHGGLIVGLTGRLLELPADSWSALIGVGNCHWVELHRLDGRWRLHSYNAGLGGVVLPGSEDEEAVAGV
ncbi:histidine phosphatase family protein [Nakamurella sp. YIM 132087]|uniref:Histidine phosphatase family protein n=1 Tax=Nakamurella alba TaxID=2665158 RepID=A0A7K1FGF6_9ACTN|nr:histidine phosphatase family protein [Nakamurella alba]MTD13140.1 histidine phosphatase family protein [Nakamurella alba]